MLADITSPNWCSSVKLHYRTLFFFIVLLTVKKIQLTPDITSYVTSHSSIPVTMIMCLFFLNGSSNCTYFNTIISTDLELARVLLFFLKKHTISLELCMRLTQRGQTNGTEYKVWLFKNTPSGIQWGSNTCLHSGDVMLL